MLIHAGAAKIRNTHMPVGANIMRQMHRWHQQMLLLLPVFMFFEICAAGSTSAAELLVLSVLLVSLQTCTHKHICLSSEVHWQIKAQC